MKKKFVCLLLTAACFRALAQPQPAAQARPASPAPQPMPSPQAPQPLRLWYTQPAQKWTEALPIGNGQLGAMVYGGIAEEHLQFNESTLWTGGPRSYQREDAHLYLDTLRQLLFAGKQSEAEALAEAHFMGKKDHDPKEYERLRTAWLNKVRADTSLATEGIDSRWRTMVLPTLNGWETAGLEGVDGAVWFRNEFILPADWSGKDLSIDLGRIRDLDHTYINGHLIGSAEGLSTKRHYTIPAAWLQPGRNAVAVQVINFDDKGGFTGVKGSSKAFVISATDGKTISILSGWKYRVQDEHPPFLPKYEAAYQPFGDLWLRFPDQQNTTGYQRNLDISQATASVSYSSSGVHYTREYLASTDQHVIALHLAADKPGHITFHAALRTPHREFSTRLIDDQTIALYIKVRDGVLKGVAYLHIETTHGQCKAAGDSISITNADEVTLYLTAATSFVNYKHATGQPEDSCRSWLPKIGDYRAIRAAHIREYQQYFNRFSITLGPASPLPTGAASTPSTAAALPTAAVLPTGAAATLPTDQRIERYSAAKDPGLVALYVQYGRYLLISSSRPGSAYPANLQGIWNDQVDPPWGSKYTTNINLEMNYWLAEPLNLSACSAPLFRLTSALSEAGHTTAAAYYKTPGWVLHHNTDLWCGTAPINASNHGIWPTGGAWLCHQLWEHYLFTGDKEFLKKYYPVLRASADFFVHFLIKDPKSGYLVSTPSASPEHGGLVAGPTMDHQIIRDLFSNCIAAARVLDIDSGFRQTLKEDFAQIAPNKVGRYGQLQEWMEDKDDTADTHRHISHLWGIYPGTEISRSTPALYAAARRSLDYRGDDGTGWSLAWKVNCWARLLQGDHAMKLVDKLLSSAAGTQGGERGGVYPNLFDAHPPFQIDGNFGGAAGIAELLLQSQDGRIDILPALPEVLAEGSVQGLCARGGFVCDLRWSDHVLQEMTIHALNGGRCVVSYGSQLLEIETQKGKSYSFNGQLKPI